MLVQTPRQALSLSFVVIIYIQTILVLSILLLVPLFYLKHVEDEFLIQLLSKILGGGYR